MFIFLKFNLRRVVPKKVKPYLTLAVLFGFPNTSNNVHSLNPTRIQNLQIQKSLVSLTTFNLRHVLESMSKKHSTNRPIERQIDLIDERYKWQQPHTSTNGMRIEEDNMAYTLEHM